MIRNIWSERNVYARRFRVVGRTQSGRRLAGLAVRNDFYRKNNGAPLSMGNRAIARGIRNEAKERRGPPGRARFADITTRITLAYVNALYALAHSHAT